MDVSIVWAPEWGEGGGGGICIYYERQSWGFCLIDYCICTDNQLKLRDVRRIHFQL